MECTVDIIHGETPDVSTNEQLTTIFLFDKKVIMEGFNISKCKIK